MKKVTETVRELALPVVEENGCKLWDVEYVREAGQWYLRIYIDKDGGVNILDCEAISRALSDILDEADPIESSYIFVIASAVAARAEMRGDKHVDAAAKAHQKAREQEDERRGRADRAHGGGA